MVFGNMEPLAGEQTSAAAENVRSHAHDVADIAR
jgi:hypothetical protein